MVDESYLVKEFSVGPRRPNFLFFFRLRVHSCENQLKEDLHENYSSLNKSFGKKIAFLKT